jgi:hypothetical protein
MSDDIQQLKLPRSGALQRRLAEHSLGGHGLPARKIHSLLLTFGPGRYYSCLVKSADVVKLGGSDDDAKPRAVRLANPS